MFSSEGVDFGLYPLVLDLGWDVSFYAGQSKLFGKFFCALLVSLVKSFCRIGFSLS